MLKSSELDFSYRRQQASHSINKWKLTGEGGAASQGM